jgi:hypothetical protein
MTAHQPANLLVAEAGEGTLVPGDPDEGEGDENGHVLCKHCNKKFATKQGRRPLWLNGSAR